MTTVGMALLLCWYKLHFKLILGAPTLNLLILCWIFPQGTLHCALLQKRQQLYAVMPCLHLSHVFTSSFQPSLCPEVSRYIQTIWLQDSTSSWKLSSYLLLKSWEAILSTVLSSENIFHVSFHAAHLSQLSVLSLTKSTSRKRGFKTHFFYTAIFWGFFFSVVLELFSCCLGKWM